MNLFLGGSQLGYNFFDFKLLDIINYIDNKLKLFVFGLML